MADIKSVDMNDEPDDNNASDTDNGDREVEKSGVKARKTDGRGVVKGVFEYIETFCYALAFMIVLFMFVFRYVSVEGPSMKNTLWPDDKLVISNLNYTPKTGDIVVIKYSPKPLIKRVIATGGQTVEIDYENWAVIVDGKLLDEPYVNRKNESMKGDKGRTAFTVEPGMIFVMGDNRNNSSDSRDLGEFREGDVLGRVLFRVFPISEFGKVDKTDG